MIVRTVELCTVDSAQATSVYDIRVFVTRDAEKCKLPVLIGVQIKGVNYRENVLDFHWDKQNSPPCRCWYKVGVHYINMKFCKIILEN